jgi:hypothetical protein
MIKILRSLEPYLVLREKTDFTNSIWVTFEKYKENFDNEHMRTIYFKLLHLMFRIEAKRG